ncbi:MAG: Maf family protein [bacterium]
MIPQSPTPRLLLASASPRRHELLLQIGVEHQQASVNTDETSHPGEQPEDYVQRVTMEKHLAAHRQYPGYVILAADTAVVVDDKILGKPKSEAHFMTMLEQLSGRTHTVMTGVAVGTQSPQYLLSCSKVQFSTVSHEQALAYWHSGEPIDKAGGYAVQGLAARFIERIEGSYSGIMGLPLFETTGLLRGHGLIMDDTCP